MNVITIAGNVTADAETRILPDNRAVVSFSVADNKGRDKPAIFWRCSWFGERAEKVAEYIVKGGAITVSGSVQEEEWTDRDGNERKGFKVLVNDVGLQGSRQSEGGEQRAPRSRQEAPERSAPRQAAPARRFPDAPQPAPARRTAPATGGSGFDDMDDDIPF